MSVQDLSECVMSALPAGWLCRPQYDEGCRGLRRKERISQIISNLCAMRSKRTVRLVQSEWNLRLEVILRERRV